MRFKVLLMILFSTCHAAGNKQSSAVPDDVYEKMIEWLRDGSFRGKKTERTATERNAYMRIYRFRQQGRIVALSKCQRDLYVDGKKLLRVGEVSAYIKNIYNERKSAGTRKIVRIAQHKVIGVCRKIAHQALDKKSHAVRFVNQRIPRPIVAKDVHERHQVDLIDFSKFSVVHRGSTYRNILSIQDVFSRYVWLRPLQSKKATEVARKLAHLYWETGPPRCVQTDNGGEFKGAVERLLKRLGCKIIRGRPYHPQSQGKVERSHRTLKDKIFFDMWRYCKTGFNWVKSLRSYQLLLNEDPKDELGQCSPFQVFYNRQSNRVHNPAHCSVSSSDADAPEDLRLPSVAAYALRTQNNKVFQEKIRKANIRASEKIINKKLAASPIPLYKIGEHVRLRYPFRKGKRNPKRRRIIKAVVLARRVMRSLYQVQYLDPDTRVMSESWVGVENLHSHGMSKERKRSRFSSTGAILARATKEDHRAKFYVEKCDFEVPFPGYEIAYDPRGDGTCQFAAVSHQLAARGIYFGTSRLRQMVVSYLQENRISQVHAERGDMANFLSDANFGTDEERTLAYEAYLERMSLPATYGDHITLQAISEIFQVNVQVVSATSPINNALVQPAVPEGTLYVGYYDENHGEHYVSLRPEVDFVCNRVSHISSDKPEVLVAPAEVEEVINEQQPAQSPASSLIDESKQEITGEFIFPDSVIEMPEKRDHLLVQSVESAGNDSLASEHVEAEPAADPTGNKVYEAGESSASSASALVAAFSALFVASTFASNGDVGQDRAQSGEGSAPEPDRGESAPVSGNDFIYFSDDQIPFIPESGLVIVSDLLEEVGRCSSLGLELRRLLIGKKRPKRKGRLVKWSSCVLQLTHDSHGWYRIVDIRYHRSAI